MILLRRLTALFVALLLFQSIWEGGGAACLSEHAAGAARGEPGGMPVMAMRGRADAKATTASVHAAMMPMEHAARAHAMGVLDDAGNARASSPTGPAETLPSHCPDSGMPAHCAAMIACSAAAASEAAGPLLATEGHLASERVVAPDARPHSRDTAPDVPPPRA